MKTIYQYFSRVFIALLLLGSFSESVAQSATLKGSVTDSETGIPIDNVVVSIKQINTHSHTDSSGNFLFLNVAPGTYDVDFNKIGYLRNNAVVTIANGEIKIINITMVFHALTLPAIGIEIDRPVTAASSTYLSKLDFENRPKNSAQDMLKLVPGLFIAQHAGGGKAEQLLIRGFDCDHGTDVATYVDGIPVNMPSHGHGQGYEDLHFLIPETVAGMEIFKGPYSPLYGNFATGAAVRFNTLDSLQDNIIQLESGFVPEVDDIAAFRGLAMLKMPVISTKISSYFATEVINNRGYFEESQQFKRVNVFSKTTFDINQFSKLQFSVSGFGSSWNASGQIPERAVKNGLITRFGSIVNTEGGTTQRNNVNLIYKTLLGSSEFVSQVYACDYKFKLYSNFTFFFDDPINGDEIEQVDQRTVRGFNAHYTIAHPLGKLKNSFTMGVSFRADDIENELWHSKNRMRLAARARANIIERATGLWANEIFRFNDHFRLELGARFDYFIFDVEDLLPTDSLRTNYSGYNYQTLVSPKINFS